MRSIDYPIDPSNSHEFLLSSPEQELVTSHPPPADASIPSVSILPPIPILPQPPLPLPQVVSGKKIQNARKERIEQKKN